MTNKLRTLYSRHALCAHLGGWQPLTLRQFVAVVASIRFESVSTNLGE
jgi:hypothetical protein